MRKRTDQLDVDILLGYVLGRDRAYLYAHPEKKLTPQQARLFLQLLDRRAKAEPIAYLTGKKEFYGRQFLVSRATLIARPETETIIEAVKEHQATGKHLRFWDIGTGNGALAVTLAKEFPAADVWASDISPAALAVAKKNARRQKARVRFFLADTVRPLKKSDQRLWRPLTKQAPLIIVANLPYIPTSRFAKLAPDIKNFEPKQALIAGYDGLAVYRKLFRELQKNRALANSIQELYLEADPEQMKPLSLLVRRVWPTAATKTIKDLAGRQRVFSVKVKKSEPPQPKWSRD